MNSKAIILLLAIASVGSMGITSQAFADEHIPYRYLDSDEDPHLPSLYFYTESKTYDHNYIIIINGEVKTVKDLDVSFVITGPTGSIVQIAQVPISSDGSFVTTINTANPMMKYDGEYKIKATYGADITHFEYVNLVEGVDWSYTPSQHEEHHEEVFDLVGEVDYSISGGHVEGVTANVNGNSLVVAIHDAEDGGELTITLPSDVITPFNDGTFFVLVNDEESDDASQDGNTITVPFDADASTIEIIGTHVVPEFGTIAAIILAVAITSIIVLSAKTKLSIMPKL